MSFFPTSEMSTQFHLLLFPRITVNIYYLFPAARSSKINAVPSISVRSISVYYFLFTALTPQGGRGSSSLHKEVTCRDR